MSIQFQLRRGTTAQVGAITPAIGEILYDTSLKRAVLGDGTTVGGIAAPYDTNGFLSSPKGIQFPAVQVPSAGANVLDDYEEGTWVPIICSASVGNPWTMTVQNGWYRKIGSVVFFQLEVTWTAKNATASNPCISLPFAANLHTVTQAAVCTPGKLSPAITGLSYFAPFSGGNLLFGYDLSGGTIAYAAYAAAGTITASGFFFTT